MIYKRGKVCWYRFKWSLKREDGTREHFLIQRSAKTGNSRKAGEVEEEHRSALRFGLVHPSDPWPKSTLAAPPTFRAFSERFKKHVSAHTKPGTARFYEACLARILNYSAVADVPLTEIGSELLSRYTQYRLSIAGNSVVTVNGDVRTLRRVMNLAHEWGVLSFVPKVHELPGEKGRERVVSQKEEAVYLYHAGGTLRDLAILAVDTGLRPDSELFPLEWVNVSLQSTPEAPNGAVCVPEGKTASAVRAVPLTARGSDLLRARRQSAHAETKFVFPGPGNGGHITTVQHAHKRTIRDGNLTPFPFYCWRHTFGTRCAESGMDRFSLARLMGHSSPRVTEKYYVHVTESHVAAGFGKFIEYQARNVIEAVPSLTEAVQ
jgi:integrase